MKQKFYNKIMKKPITSDELLYIISSTKENINKSILRSVKETASKYRKQLTLCRNRGF